MRSSKGWLSAPAVIDLYGQKVIVLSMGERMTKELVLKVLDEAYMRFGEAGRGVDTFRPWQSVSFP